MTNNCGTHAGFARHRRAKETPCQPCRDALNLYNKKWKENHAEQVKDSRKRYRKENHNAVLEKNAKWRKDNPEYIKNWHKNNWGKVKQHKKKWVLNNPEKAKAIKVVNQNRRRSRMEGSLVIPYTVADVLDLYGLNCHICNNKIDLNASRKTGGKGWELGLQIDHVIPISKNGADTIENVRPSHGKCNSTKRANILEVK